MTTTLSRDIQLGDAPLLIGDETLNSASGGVVDHVFAGTGEVNGTVHLAGIEEVNRAVKAAKDAFPVWQAVPVSQRRDLLMSLAKRVVEETDGFTRIVTMEMGAPRIFSSTNPAICSNWIAYYAGWADKISGEVLPSFPANGLNYTIAEPYGVVAVLTPWNGPLSEVGMKASPALAAGNCIVIKPSELAPYSTIRWAELALEVGFPPGVVNVLTGGAEAGDALCRHPDIGKVSFTGSPGTARRIIEASGEQIRPLTLELGGKSPNVIFADADLDRAIPLAVSYGLALMSGQACSAGTRLLVDERVHDEVIERLTTEIAKYVIGDPRDETTTFGPLVNAAAQKRVSGVIETARSAGDGRVAIGGGVPGGQLAAGFFVEPTVFDDVPPEAAIFQEEIFGPVMAVTRFKTVDEAIELCNSTKYGLAAYINTRDITLAHSMATRLRCGSVRINGANRMAPGSPFGGYGESGFGREGGREGLEEFLQIKNVFVDLG